MKARENPFASDRIESLRFRPQGWTWGELLTRLDTMRFRAAIVGPHGSGKTTLLEELSSRLEATGRRCRMASLHSHARRLDDATWRRLTDGLDDRDVVLVDGAEQLSAIGWSMFQLRCRRAGGLLITTHSPGRLPTLVQTTTSPALLRELVGDLTNTRSDDDLHADSLLLRHRGNIRDALRELYDAACA